MSRREVFVVIALLFVLIAVNTVSYIQRANLEKNTAILVEEGKVQISINQADTDEFAELPGIGPVLANRVVDYRKANGRFQTLEDLKKVKGIGDKLFKKILAYIKL